MEKKIGKIQFLPFASGTKSESLQPFLIDKDGNKIHVYKKDDNPFMNNYFNAFEGKSVCVSGEYSNNTFIIDSITEDIVVSTSDESQTDESFVSSTDEAQTEDTDSDDSKTDSSADFENDFNNEENKEIGE
ncbi:MAG: hypothetical protein K5829_08975 [Treponema sp.]|nr:hypothetical protein [Treponema sp.]